MPSLDSQNGTWENIDQYDFLVASRKLSYDTDLGNVPFRAIIHLSTFVTIKDKHKG